LKRIYIFTIFVFNDFIIQQC